MNRGCAATPCRARWSDGGRSALAPCYVGAALSRARANLCGCAAAAAALLASTGCGGGDRRDADAPGGSYRVEVRRASFAPEQHLGQRRTLVISVRNAGDQTIPNLTLTVRGFSDRSRGPRDADLGRELWIVDRAPPGAMTAFEDTWTAGRLDPADTATLRWEVTPVVAGRHELTYEIAPAVAGSGRIELARGGEARGSISVRVTDRPPSARVDPRTGEIRRQE